MVDKSCPLGINGLKYRSLSGTKVNLISRAVVLNQPGNTQ